MQGVEDPAEAGGTGSQPERPDHLARPPSQNPVVRRLPPLAALAPTARAAAAGQTATKAQAHAIAASILTPAVAALTLGAYGHEEFSAQPGGNARYASLALWQRQGCAGGHRIFYHDGKPIEREKDLQILCRLVWFDTPSDVSTRSK